MQITLAMAALPFSARRHQLRAIRSSSDRSSHVAQLLNADTWSEVDFGCLAVLELKGPSPGSRCLPRCVESGAAAATAGAEAEFWLLAANSSSTSFITKHRAMPTSYRKLSPSPLQARGLFIYCRIASNGKLTLDEELEVSNVLPLVTDRGTAASVRWHSRVVASLVCGGFAPAVAGYSVCCSQLAARYNFQ